MWGWINSVNFETLITKGLPVYPDSLCSKWMGWDGSKHGIHA